MHVLRTASFSFLLLFTASFIVPLPYYAHAKSGVTIPVEGQRPTQKPMRIRLPEAYRKKARKIRIRNLTTGKEAIVDVSDEEFISSDLAASLLDKNSKNFEPEFSILEITRPTKKSYTKTEILGQSFWRPLTFHVVDENGEVEIELDVKNAKLAAPSESESERRRPMLEDRGLKRLFEIGWKALRVKRPDVAQEAFSRILAKGAALSDEQREQAALGHGIALFHEKGCAAAEPDLAIADRDLRNHDDVSYFRALCMVEAKRFPEARVLFEDLVQKLHPLYAEPSRYYLGVVAESQDRTDDAKSAFLDTVDFAKDTRLVQLSREHLAALQRREEAEHNSESYLGGALTLGGGYDSNVVALPRGIDPSDFSVSDEAATSLAGILLLELRLIKSEKADGRLRYLMSAFHYGNESISDLYDLQSHEIGWGLSWALSDSWRLDSDIAYNSLFLGPLGSSGEYLATPYVQFKLDRLIGPPAQRTADWDNSFKLSFPRPRRAVSSPELDLTANDYLFASHYNVHRGKQILGPGLEVDYHPSSGILNSFYSFNVLGRWDLPLGPDSWGVFVNQEGALGAAIYYASTDDRKDMSLRYTASIARPWTDWLETRLQFVGTLAFSSLKSKYQYQRAQLNFLITAVF